MNTILSLDVGTSSIRCIIYTDTAERLYGASFSYSPVYLNDGRVRQSIATWREGLYAVLGECGAYLAKNTLIPSAIAVTSQRASVIPIDKNGEALSDAIMWQDKTTFDQCAKLAERIDSAEIYRITGLRNDPYFSLPKILWLQENEPEIYNRTACFLGVQDYIAYLLTGRIVTDHSQACRTMLMDIVERTWSHRMLQASGLQVDMLPELVSPGAVIGTISPALSEMAGIDAEMKVILAGGDQQVAAVGMGVFQEGLVEANTGTGSFLISPSGEPVFHPEARTLCSISAVPGQWVIEAGVLTTGILYDWFAREFVPEQGGYEAVNRLVESSPAGANGIILLPHFKGGAAPYWNPYAKGVFFNMTLANTRADMARAVLEGIVLEMGADLELIRSVAPSPIRSIVAAGGLTRFEIFNQLQADIFNTELTLPAAEEASSLGALISALVSLGRYKDHAEAFAALKLQATVRIQPRPESSTLYKKSMYLKDKLYHVLEESNIYNDAYEYNTMLLERQV